jgi:broad specificity phosphatase PhoE
VRTVEFRRHAARQKDADALSPEGRAQAEEVGRSFPTDFAIAFVSPAQRAAETMAWFLRGSGQPLPPHAVIPDLASGVEDRWRAAAKAAGSARLDAVMRADPDLVSEEADRLAGAARALFDRVPDHGKALAVGHTPLIEATVYGLTGAILEPLGECEGVSVTRDDSGGYRLKELRLG